MGRYFIDEGGGVARECVTEGTKVHTRLVQPGADAIMRRNAELRKSRGAVKTTTFGKLELDIPIAHLRIINRFYPGIADPGHPDHKWQLRRFMASPASAAYRVQELDRSANRGRIIIN